MILTIKCYQTNANFQKKLFLFSWSGTVCDAGVFAPVLSFQKLFEAEGVPITDAETRAPMGVHKRVSNDKWLVRKW